MNAVFEKFRLPRKAFLVTGGAGLLGVQHCHAIAEAGGIAIALDNSDHAIEKAKIALKHHGSLCRVIKIDVLDRVQIEDLLDDLQLEGIDVGGLVNNLDYNPQMSADVEAKALGRFEQFPEAEWDFALDLGLKAAFVCSQAVGARLIASGGGVVVNVCSDLSLIAPDQRIYRDPDLTSLDWPVKPVTYSVSKFGLVGLTKYLATYWAEKNVRVNAIAFGSVRSNQSPYLDSQLKQRIPLGRLAEPDEYKGALIFSLSEASSYMTGAVTVLDGGRSIW